MERRWLSRNLLLLTAISLTQDAASELLYPLLPFLVTGLLAAPPVVLGVIEGCAEGAAGVAKYVAGRWSDATRRRPFISAGYGLAALGKIIVAAAAIWPIVLLGRVVDRLGKGIRSAPRDALIAASVPRADLGRAFGFHRAGDTLGAVIGPLLALIALGILDGDVRAVIWWAVVPAVLSVGLTLFVKERARPKLEPKPESTPLPYPNKHRGRSPLPRQFWQVTLVLVLIALVNFPDALLLLRFSSLGYSESAVVIAYILYNLVYTLASYPAGALSDRLPQSVIYGVGLLAFGAAYGGLAFVGQGPWAFALLAGYGLFPALTDGVGKAWISSLVDDEVRGRAQGVFQALGNGAVLIAGLWAGLTWGVGVGGGRFPLIIAGCMALFAGVALIVAGRHLAPTHTR